MLEAKDLIANCFELIKRTRRRTSLPHHHGSPLLLAHRPGTRIGQYVNVTALRTQAKYVIACTFQRFLPPRLVYEADRFDHLNAERFGDVFRHAAPLTVIANPPSRCG